MSDTIWFVDLPSTTVSGQVDVVELTPGDDRPIEIVGIFFGQDTDFGEAEEEQLGLQVIRGHTVSGSGGSTSTPRPAKRNRGTAGFTAEIFNTTIASAGTTHILPHDVWNVRLPYSWRELLQEESPEATQGDTTMVVRLAAPADGIDIEGYIAVREKA